MGALVFAFCALIVKIVNLYHNHGKTYKNKKQAASAIFHGASFFVLLVTVIAIGVFAFKVYLSEKNVQVLVKNTENISRGDPILVSFSTKMLKSSVEQGLVVEPKIKLGLRWKTDTSLEVIPIETPLPESSYRVRISNFQSGWFIPQKEVEFTFSTPKFPTLTGVYPDNGQMDVDYFEHIVIDFEQPVGEDFKLEIAISPLTGFSHSLNDARTQLVIEPKEHLDKNTKYSINAKVIHQEHESENKDLYQGNFITKQPPQIVYSLDANGNPSKTEDRKEELTPTIKEGKSIQINLSSQTLLIYENGKELGAYKVSTGLRGMDTPQGTFKVLAKARRPWSAKYKLYMPWFIQFTKEGHGIHELPEWPGGLKEGASHLGIPVSHGCVRLGIGPAKVAYDFAEVNVPIVIQQ